MPSLPIHPILNFLPAFGDVAPQRGEEALGLTFQKEAHSPELLEKTPEHEGVGLSAIAEISPYERGFEEGLKRARHEHLQEIEMLRAQFQEDIEKERSLLLERHLAQIFKKLDLEFQNIIAKLSDDLTSVLTPFVCEQVREHALCELKILLEETLLQHQGNIHISGPQNLIEALNPLLEKSGTRITCTFQEEIDLKISLDHTVIKTNLEAWFSRFSNLVQKTCQEEATFS